MHSSCFCNIIVFILLLNIPKSSSTSKKGPYKSNIVSMEKCVNPPFAYVKDPSIIITTINENTTNPISLSCNITISRDTMNVRMRMMVYIWENNKWKMIYEMNDITCHGILLSAFSRIANIKIDNETCTFPKGQYNIKNLDVLTNIMMHVWASKIEYGKIMLRSEALNGKIGTIFCYEVVTITEPA